MTNITDPATLLRLKTEAQSQFKMAAVGTRPEGIALLMDNGEIIGGHPVAKFGKTPARTAMQDALHFLTDLFGSEAMGDTTLRQGQKIVAVAIATAVTETSAKLKKPSAQLLADLGAYKGLEAPQKITVVSGNSLESQYEFTFAPIL